MSKYLLIQLKTMKFNLSLLLTLLLFIAGNIATAQDGKKRKKNNKSTSNEILEMKFERLQEDEEVSELGSISLLDNGVFSPTEIAADLFQRGSGAETGIPDNKFGSQKTMAEGGGDIYAGIVAFKSGKESKDRSYITIPLPRGLKKEGEYCVQFNVSLAESSKYACNNIGAYFTKGDPSTERGLITASENVIRGKYNQVYKGFSGWRQVCDVYKAKGGENFITIGNFDINEETKSVQVKKPKSSDVESLKHAYYYIDNITVTFVDSADLCECINITERVSDDGHSKLIYTKSIHIDESMSTQEKVAAQKLFFGYGKSSFTLNSQESLKFLYSILVADPSTSIEIMGHSDNNEEASDNPKIANMGLQRANYVKEYLLYKGIDESRIKVKSMRASVESDEINENDEEELRDAKSRRVEFKLN